MNQCPHCKSQNIGIYLGYKVCLECKQTFDVFRGEVKK